MNFQEKGVTVSPTIQPIAARGQESEDAKNAAVCREILTGEELRRKSGEMKRERHAAQEALQMKNHRTIGDLGLCVANVPMVEYIHLTQKYGAEELNDRAFWKDFGKRFPHLCPHKA